MGFDDLISKCNSRMVGRFGNADVILMLNGVAVKSFRCVYNEFGEVVSLYDSERLVIQPVMTVESAELQGLTSSVDFDITPDSGKPTKQYKLDGKPVPDGTGLTVVHLAEKK